MDNNNDLISILFNIEFSFYSQCENVIKVTMKFLHCQLYLIQFINNKYLILE